MIKRYIKHTWAMLRQQKLFGTLYIIGTAIPVALTMIVITFQNIRVGSIYPEEHREELWCSQLACNNTTMGPLSLSFAQKCFYPLKGAEAVTAMRTRKPVFVQLPDGKNMISVNNLPTDPAFFRVFDFQFLEGKPFSDADFSSGRQCAVVAASLARRLFGDRQAVGRTILLDYAEYTITGVVRDASSLTPLTYAQLYTPYTCLHEEINPTATCGPYKVCIRAGKDKGPQLQAEVEEYLRKYRLLAGDSLIHVEIPRQAWEYNQKSKFGFIDDDTVQHAIRVFGGLILMFLLVPALNLSGMISGQMEGRLPEMGIYKAFGATRSRLLKQVLGENLVLTLLGGLIGLLLSWGILVLGRSWVFDFFSPGFYLGSDTDVLINADMLFSPWVFLFALLVCIVLNVASALIPAWTALRTEIVYSLNQKK